MGSAVIIGGGAAGCLCAVELKRRCPSCSVTVLEAGREPMAKLSLTGGGRCNITNTFEFISDLHKAYPRGAQLLKRAFYRFGPKEAMEWWDRSGVPFEIQAGGRVFPVSQNAKDVVRTLSNLMKEYGVGLVCQAKVVEIAPEEGGFRVSAADGREYRCDCAILTAGGTSSGTLSHMLPPDIGIKPTVPSLFTFKINDPEMKALMGLSVPDASLCICGTSIRSEGALLLTDWGLSGPAVLKLSSYAAEYLNAHQYRAELSINWLGLGEAEAAGWIDGKVCSCGGKMMRNSGPQDIPERLWHMILHKSDIRENCRWGELSGKGRAKLLSCLIGCVFSIEGRAAFKEEFVTCGGVSLDSINTNTLESKTHKGLFFAGEVLDVDGITGGFNLQAAWSTGYVAAEESAAFLNGKK